MDILCRSGSQTFECSKSLCFALDFLQQPSPQLVSDVSLITINSQETLNSFYWFQNNSRQKVDNYFKDTLQSMPSDSFFKGWAAKFVLQGKNL